MANFNSSRGAYVLIGLAFSIFIADHGGVLGQPQVVDVVIIGGGLSGVSAAKLIDDSNTGTSYIILEGQDRLGGRLQKFQGFGDDGSWTLEEGANWVHDASSDDPIYRLIEEYGVTTAVNDHSDVEAYRVKKHQRRLRRRLEYSRYKNQRNRPFTNTKNRKMMRAGAKQILSEGVFRQLDENNDEDDDDDDDDDSVADADDMDDNISTEEISFDELEQVRDEFYAARECIEASAKEYKSESFEDHGVVSELASCGWDASGNDVKRLVQWVNVDYDYASEDASLLSSYPSSGGSPDAFEALIADDKGYEYIVNRMADDLSHPYRLNAEVSKVEWEAIGDNPDYPVVVHVMDTSTFETTTIHCKKVISTVSVGVLRERPQMFDPPLDLSSNPFAMKVYTKLWFQFPQKFWNDSEFMMFSVPEDMVDNACWRWQNLDKKGFYEGSRILFCTLVDEAFTNLAPNGELSHVALEHLLKPLKATFGEKYVEPNDYHYYNWGENTWTFGSFANRQFGDNGGDFAEFFRPKANAAMDNVVYLAGAASCERHWDVVQGAYYGGQKAAAMALEDLGYTGVEFDMGKCDLD